MSAPYSDIQSKTEAALKAEIEQVSSVNRGTADVYLGLDCDVELSLPRIECHADQGPEDPHDSGNYWMDCSINIVSSANEALSTHRSRTKYVFDRFAVDFDTLRTNLTGRVSDFTCIGVREKGVAPQVKEDRHVISTLKVQLLCCTQDFPN